jgi:hypothetical protein
MKCPPILFLIFNRPDTTAQVFDAIRQARPSRLYVAADGARADKDGEAARCDEARRVATQINWPCEVKTIFRDQNLGCGRAVSSAITWFFEHEEEGIILEDDCLPALEFFRFCEELLKRYKDDSRIMAICGSSYAPTKVAPKQSYYFSYYADIWGWATWRRAWNLYDWNLAKWVEFKRSCGGRLLGQMAPWRFQYWENCFDLAAKGEIDTWDYQWLFTVIESDGLACYPARNLISNLGYRPDATHTKTEVGLGVLPAPASLPLDSLDFPLTHPHKVGRTERQDRQIEMVRLNLTPPPPYLKRIWNSLSLRIGKAGRSECLRLD